MVEESNYIKDIVIPSAALIVSVAAVYFTWKGLKLQRAHNIKSMKPIGKFKLGDYESKLLIGIDNYGVGPLILKSLVLNGHNMKNGETFLKHFDFNELPKTKWQNFTGFQKDRTIPSGGYLPLLEWSIDNDLKKSEEDIELTKKICRRNFKDWVVKITYTDIYESEVFTEELELDWFGRKLKP